MSTDPDDILSPPDPINLLPASVVAATIAPLMPGTDASAWLRDMRRSRPGYRPRVSRPPTAIRRGRRVFYPRSELVRLLDELGSAELDRMLEELEAQPAPIKGASA